MSNETLTLKLKDICRNLYHSNKIRGTQYKNVLKRLEKLATYRLYAQKNDPDGPSEKIILHLLDIHYSVPIQQDSPVMSEVGDTSDGIDLQFFEGKDISETILEIIPGKTLRDSWKENKISKVYSNLYNSIEDSRARTFLFILEAERLRINPSTSISLPYTFFQERLRFNMKKKALREEICKNLDFLKNHSVLIDNYELNVLNVNITFLPFSDIEKLVYKLNERVLLSDDVSK